MILCIIIFAFLEIYLYLLNYFLFLLYLMFLSYFLIIFQHSSSSHLKYRDLCSFFYSSAVDWHFPTSHINWRQFCVPPVCAWSDSFHHSIITCLLTSVSPSHGVQVWRWPCCCCCCCWYCCCWCCYCCCWWCNDVFVVIVIVDVFVVTVVVVLFVVLCKRAKIDKSNV